MTTPANSDPVHQGVNNDQLSRSRSSSPAGSRVAATSNSMPLEHFPSGTLDRAHKVVLELGLTDIDVDSTFSRLVEAVGVETLRNATLRTLNDKHLRFSKSGPGSFDPSLANSHMFSQSLFYSAQATMAFYKGELASEHGQSHPLSSWAFSFEDGSDLKGIGAMAELLEEDPNIDALQKRHFAAETTGLDHSDVSAIAVSSAGPETEES